ncbi:DNA-binding response regulator [Paenibacillus sp. 598K]|uniref:response regulator n=1 Tax=Paenibacillus sp. 598K TaxID=1117987 RepID=UPI000FF93057|nr:response regulator [Paenibacillus sp. 598K]GBF71888.1 DNA-binding response regulator [Paenibacillus sp. 598K]
MRTVMLVDDESHIVDALSRHVGWERLQLRVVCTAADGEEAYRQFLAVRPELIITDVNMPGMNGLELAEALRAEDAELPIVILSGFDEFEHARQAMRFGVHHFLLKPASVIEIEAVLEEIVQELDTAEEKRRLEERYRHELDRMLPYLREKFLYDLLTTRYQSHELDEERLAFLGIRMPRQAIAVSLRITRPALLVRLGERDWQLLRFGADNMLRELLQEMTTGTSVQGDLVNDSDNLFVLLLMDTEDTEDTKDTGQAGEIETADQEDEAERLAELAERLALSATEKIAALLKIEAVAGIGASRSSLHELIDSYLESRSALEAAEFLGASRVHPYTEWAKLDTDFDRYGSLLKRWSETVAAREPEKVRELWRELHERLRGESGGSMVDVQTICVSLFSSLMLSWNDAFPQQEPPCSMSRFLQEIQQQFSLERLTGWLDGLICGWLEQMTQELSGRRGNRLVDCVERYVEEHYSREISFAAIAAELFVHPKYLSQLFKRVTGQNFVQYLNNYRVRKAIHYLQSGQHMIYEVSEMVGFNNPTYFSQVFKMITGKSPSEYVRGSV